MCFSAPTAISPMVHRKVLSETSAIGSPPRYRPPAGTSSSTRTLVTGTGPLLRTTISYETSLPNGTASGTIVSMESPGATRLDDTPPGTSGGADSGAAGIITSGFGSGFAGAGGAIGLRSRSLGSGMAGLGSFTIRSGGSAGAATGATSDLEPCAGDIGGKTMSGMDSGRATCTGGAESFALSAALPTAKPDGAG